MCHPDDYAHLFADADRTAAAVATADRGACAKEADCFLVRDHSGDCSTADAPRVMNEDGSPTSYTIYMLTGQLR